MIRKWLALGIVAGVSLFSACSSASTTANSGAATTAAAPASSGEQTSAAAANSMEQIANAMAGVKTYSMTMTMNVDSSMAKTKTKIEAVVDVTDPSASKMKGTTTTSGIEVKLIKIGDKIWVKGATTGGKWQKLPASSAQVSATDSADMTKALQQMQAAVSETTTVGTETVDGVEATHYKFVIDVAAYNKALGGKAVVSGDTFDYDVWADADGLMRKMETTMKMDVSGQKIESNLSATMSDFNEPVTIKAP